MLLSFESSFIPFNHESNGRDVNSTLNTHSKTIIDGACYHFTFVHHNHFVNLPIIHDDGFSCVDTKAEYL